jgi:hypothetical protein
MPYIRGNRGRIIRAICAIFTRQKATGSTCRVNYSLFLFRFNFYAIDLFFELARSGDVYFGEIAQNQLFSSEISYTYVCFQAH